MTTSIALISLIWENSMMIAERLLPLLIMQGGDTSDGGGPGEFAVAAALSRMHTWICLTGDR